MMLIKKKAKHANVMREAVRIWIYWNWECGYDTAEDSKLFLRMLIYFFSDSDLRELKMLIYWN